jgi:uncharacterized protein YjbI with pentapeptide repeats
LEEARLDWASFDQADLGGANLKYAFVVGADFKRAKGLILPQLESARFWVLSQLPSGYDLPLANQYNSENERFLGSAQGRFFAYSDLRRLDLSGADLHSYNLDYADLRLANLRGANLRGASLRNAKVFLTHFEDCLFEPEQVKKMSGWQLGYYSAGLAKRLGLPPDHDHNLPTKQKPVGTLDSQYDLSNADLSDMDLSSWTFNGTNLSNAELNDANLRQTSFKGADLLDVVGLGSKIFMTDFRGARHFKLEAFTVIVPRVGGGVEEESRCTKELAFLDGNAKHDRRLNLHDLSGADLRSCPLENVDFDGYDLRNADLRGASLAGASLAESSSSLSERKVKLAGAKLDGANVRFARFAPFIGTAPIVNVDSKFRRMAWDSDLTPTQARTASNSRLAVFPLRIEAALFPMDPIHYVAILERRCRGCSLNGADMHDGDLCGSDFRGADLRKGNFIRANLRQASLAGADLNGAIFVGAYVAWTDFRGAKNLSAERIRDARNWSSGYFDLDKLADLGLPADHNESLKRLSEALGISTGTGCSTDH